MKKIFTFFSLCLLTAGIGMAQPVDGKYYRIASAEYDGRVVAENVATNELNGSMKDESDYMQVWKVSVTGSAYKFENAVTGHFIANNTGNYSTLYYARATGGSFNLSGSADSYSIADGSQSTYGLHCASSQSYNIVKWGTDAGASKWKFEEVEVDEAALQASKESYAAYGEMKDNAAAYTEVLAGIFTDGSCAELNDAYKSASDADLLAALGTLPQPIKDMALKVKNNTWTVYEEGWNKTEKTYRIASYKAYSDFQKWTSITGMGYSFGRLTNPTGVRVEAGDVLQVYVGDVPRSATGFALEIVGEGQAAGKVYNLRTGFNVVKSSTAGHAFIFYIVNNTTTTPYTDIDSYPEIPVHIEGGTVCGYFDQTKGDTNDDWAKMQQYTFSGPTIIMKSSHHIYNLDRVELLKACPTEVNGMMDCWSRIAQMEDETMGLYEDFGGKFNNMWSITSIDYNYMFATTYGTYYNKTTMGSVFNYKNMLTSAGSLWGPAHEQGHNRQKLINMIGCTEVSNNVFSNIAVYNQGYATSRASSIKTTMNEFHKGISWLDRVHDNSVSSGQADLWQCTHLYWQLYQFFHLRGFAPNFYPDLFRAMRKSPMDHSGGTFVSAANDYLKFYVTCCQVSGYDLTEFFDVYGFFMLPTTESHTINGSTRQAHFVGDYNNFYVTCAASDIAAAKRRVAGMNLKPCNAIFIEDRITAPAATYDGATATSKKVAFSNEYPIGSSNGQLGQYTDFYPEDQFADGDYVYDLCRTTIIINNPGGKGGAVGFKVYDTNGKLVYVANTRNFTLPADLVEAGFVIKAAEGNGNDHVVPNIDDVSGINAAQLDKDGNFIIFDLSGRRVEKPAKGGVYIVGGKKVMF